MEQEKIQELEKLINNYKTVNQTETEIITGNFLKIGVSDYTLENGEIIRREELVKNNGNSSAVVILPLTEYNEVVLVVQPRVLTNSTVGVELPAGYIDGDKTGNAAALRELREETGYIPAELIKVGSYYQDQGCMRGLNECFVAMGCKKTEEQDLDDSEFVSEFVCSYSDTLELVEQGIIQDAGSIITLERSKSLIKKL